MKVGVLVLILGAAVALRLESQLVVLAAMTLLARGMVFAWPATSSSAKRSPATRTPSSN